MKKTRRAFKLEFKREVVRQAMQPGNRVAAFCRDIGLHESVLRRWIKELGSDSEGSRQVLPGNAAQAHELSRLRKQVNQKRMAREAVAYALGSFPASSRMDRTQPVLSGVAEVQSTL